MKVAGILTSWNNDKGFGFISPVSGGPEVFVHISELPRDGTKPAIGERLTYELAPGRNGRHQAVNVVRQALASSPQKLSFKSEKSSRKFSLIPTAFLFALALATGFIMYKQLDQPTARKYSSSCDGRKFCSQMTSCTEAKFYLKNCPDTQMDGDNDGTPCEEQWCTSIFSK